MRKGIATETHGIWSSGHRLCSEGLFKNTFRGSGKQKLVYPISWFVPFPSHPSVRRVSIASPSCLLPGG